MRGLDIDREFFVLAVANAKGEYTAPYSHHHPLLGPVVFLFTSEEKLTEYAESLDENQAFMDILERAPREVGSEDLNLGGCLRTSVRSLSARLKAYEIENLLVDYLSPGGLNRVY